MAWSRFSTAGVYTFPDMDGSLECCACSLMEGSLDSFRTTDVETFLIHLGHHRDAGDEIPAALLDVIRVEGPEYAGIPAQPRGW